VVDLHAAYQAWLDGDIGQKPVARRCGGALFLNTWFGEPVPAGKCDSGLTWSPGFCIKNADPWKLKVGTTAPMNGYMQLSKAGTSSYQRALISSTNCAAMKTVLSETYVHMWEPNYDLPVSGSCIPESNASFCSRRRANCGSITGTDNCRITRTVASCGSCATGQVCGGEGTSNVCGNTNRKSYEGEALVNTLVGLTVGGSCAQAYTKFGTSSASTVGSCSGGGKARYIGNGPSNYLTIPGISAPTTGYYQLMVYGFSLMPRTVYMSVNGGTGTTLKFEGPTWDTPVAVAAKVYLNAGSNNSIKFYNDTGNAPDIDRITVTGGSCIAESNTDFCARLVKNCGSVTATDNCGIARTVSSCGACAAGLTCGRGLTASYCAVPFSTNEAESSVHTRAGTAVIDTCGPVGAYGTGCSAGAFVRRVGGNTNNYMVFNVNASTARTYTLTIYGYVGGSRSIYISANGATGISRVMTGPDWYTRVSVTASISLRSGSNAIKLYNNTANGPDLDGIMLQ
jgi:hypothetical protein